MPWIGPERRLLRQQICHRHLKRPTIFGINNSTWDSRYNAKPVSFCLVDLFLLDLDLSNNIKRVVFNMTILPTYCANDESPSSFTPPSSPPTSSISEMMLEGDTEDVLSHLTLDEKVELTRGESRG
jgi:hypothetical protein